MQCEQIDAASLTTRGRDTLVPRVSDIRSIVRSWAGDCAALRNMAGALWRAGLAASIIRPRTPRSTLLQARGSIGTGSERLMLCVLCEGVMLLPFTLGKVQRSHCHYTQTP